MILLGCSSQPEKAKVVFTHSSTSVEETKFLKKLIKEFEDNHPHIDVIFKELPADTNLQYKYYIEAFGERLHEIPDVFSLDVMWFPQFAEAGWFSFIEWFFKEKDEFLAGAIKGCIYQHGIYAIPWSVDGGVLFYRKDLLTKYKFPCPPRTFDELLHQVKVIRTGEQKSSLYGFIWPGTRCDDLVSTFLEILWGNEGILLQGTEVLVNTLWAREALQLMHDLIYKYNVTPVSVTTMNTQDCINVFRAGNAIFLRAWSDMWQTVYTTSMKDKIGIAPIPCFSRKGRKSASCLKAQLLAINKGSLYEKEAWDLVRFLTSEYVQRKLALSLYKNPTRKSLYDDAQIKENIPIISEFYFPFVYLKPRPITRHYYKISKIMEGYISEVLTQHLSVQEALNKAVEEIEKVFH
jgi:multiple sugar transport system substrate-binding protein